MGGGGGFAVSSVSSISTFSSTPTEVVASSIHKYFDELLLIELKFKNTCCDDERMMNEASE
mgnify:CR=1 FL=1